MRNLCVTDRADLAALPVLGEYAGHCNVHRLHRALRQNSPVGHQHPPAEVTGMCLLRRNRLGGLIQEYAQIA